MLLAENETWRQLLADQEAIADGGVPAAPDAAAGMTLPGDRALSEVLEARRAVREFAPRPLAPDTLASVLSAAATADRERCGAIADKIELTIMAAAISVDGWRPSLYHLSQAPVPVDETVDMAQLITTYAAAPALVFVCLDLSAAARAVGARGYPWAVTRSAAYGYAAWLAALSTGLDACVYGGASSTVTRAARGLLGTPVRHLFTVAVGYAA
jgi:nitroreductase